MREDILRLIINIIINFLEVIICYYICHNLIEKKPKLSINLVALGVLCGVILGTMVNYLDSYTYRVVATLTMIAIIKLLSKRRIHEVIIIYAIYFLIGIFIEILLLLIISSAGLNQIYNFLLVQILSLHINMFLYLYVPLSKLLNKIEKSLFLKLLIFNLVSVILVSLFYVNFEYTQSYLLYFLLLIVVTCICIYHTLKRVSYYTNEMPAQVHDIKNILIVLQILACNSPNKELKAELETAIEILGLDVNIDDIEVEGFNKSILAIINKKQKNNIKESSIVTDIKYVEKNCKVGFLAIGYMLGILLDNAIETGTKKPILVKIWIDSDSLIMSVANEYEKKCNDDFQKMFQRGNSSKGKDGRGHGLPNLSKFVYRHDGEIVPSYEYNKKQECDYLIITIDMGNWKLCGSRWIEKVLLL